MKHERFIARLKAYSVPDAVDLRQWELKELFQALATEGTYFALWYAFKLGVRRGIHFQERR